MIRACFIDDEFQAQSSGPSQAQQDYLRGLLQKHSIQFNFHEYEPDLPASGQIRDACQRIVEEPDEEGAFVDVVVLDVNFPAPGGGYEMAGLVEALPLLAQQHIPVIVRSGEQELARVVEILTRVVPHRCPYVIKGRRPPGRHQARTDGGVAYDDDLPQVILDLVRDRPRPLPLEKAVLVTHGTDTLSWALAVLKYMLKDVNSNVVLTGAMQPLDQAAFAASDAIENVKASVQVLAQLSPPAIVVVFARGENVFSGNLYKISQVAPDAFKGDLFAHVVHNELRYAEAQDKPGHGGRIKRLHLIKTGGTIDSKYVAGRGFVPIGDYVASYVTGQLGQYYSELSTHSIRNPVDSSNMSIGQWKEVARIIDKDVTGNGAQSDYEGFDERVRIVHLSPFETTADLIDMAKGSWNGFVLLGYGSGNGNISCCRFSRSDDSGTPERCCFQEESRETGGPSGFDPTKYFAAHPCGGFAITPANPNEWCPVRRRDLGGSHSVVEFVRLAVATGKYVVLSSQVPFGPADIEYEAGRMLVRAGAVPAADLSPAEAQVKLAYVLGHLPQIRRKVRKINADGVPVTERQVVTACMLAGCRFRKKLSEEDYLNLCSALGQPLALLAHNPFVFQHFASGLDAVVERLLRVLVP